MTRHSLICLPALLLGALSFSGLAEAANPACQWYVQTSARQQQDNLQRACGLKGTEWTIDVRALGDFCEKQAPEVWKALVQQRQQKLDACGKK